MLIGLHSARPSTLVPGRVFLRGEVRRAGGVIVLCASTFLHDSTELPTFKQFSRITQIWRCIQKIRWSDLRQAKSLGTVHKLRHVTRILGSGG